MNVSDRDTLRVAVNAYFSQRALTGSGQYLAQLLAALPSAAPWCLLSLYCPSRRGAALRMDDLSMGPELGQPSPSPLAKLCFEQLGFPRAAAASAQVLHYPYWAAPLHVSLPTVVTVHDLIPLLLDPYRGPLPVRAYTALVAVATRRATMLIADSQATKNDIVARLNVSPDRVRVIYLAAAQRFHPAPAGESHALLCQKYGLDRPFLFYIGGLDSRKNVPLLMRAFARVSPSLPSRYLLAIAGNSRKQGPLFPDLPVLARDLQIADSVRFLGVAPDEDIPALYQAAAAVAFPSLYEGFGLPALEALACAAPLLCSNRASLPEIVGGAALTVDSLTEEAWSASLVRILTDQSLRATLVALGPRQAARFNWRLTAEETAAVYLEAFARWHSCGRGASCTS